MSSHRIFSMSFAKIYPLYVQKVERKERAREDLDRVLTWLTGYDEEGLARAVDGEVDVETFLTEAPAYNPHADLITGVICGVRVEEIEDPLMKRVRQMDKLVDEVARGKRMESILRG
ncbi:DUF2200 domain-containing protein [Demequina pelophila]|uniref:DUF2200 domain-containing protein n=1 Tax=Demequina pelophila TaxID=1638984 RepID=UPI000785D0C3|nr:DUF2200 domain-containing protein [Demequina pelophila]